MKRPWILAIIAVGLAVVAVLAFAYPHRMIAPGPLIPAHTALTRNCFACHAPFRGAAVERCVACHSLSSIGVRTVAGGPVKSSESRPPFHQNLANRDCMACHDDHRVPGLSRPGSPRFVHTMLAPAVQADCASCHTAPKDTVHPTPTPNCGTCHQTRAWKPATFEHGRFFDLTGDHNAPCATCHVGNDTSRYTCFGCHEHQPAAIAARHRREGIVNITNCVSCHRGADEGEGGEREGGDEGDDD